MGELLKGLALGLVAFLAVNASACALLPIIARPWLRVELEGSAERRAQALLALRLFPAAASLFAVFALFIPAYLTHEPAGSGETVGWPLLALAGLSCLVLGSAVGRGLAAWRRSRQLARSWERRAQRVEIAFAGRPVLRITHRFPVVAVLGVFRPRLYAAAQVLSALSADELGAVLEHERAHLDRRDNLRHWLLRACPDLLAWFPWGGRFAAVWRAAAEEAADERVARRGPAAGLALAGALLKVARMVPVDCPYPEPDLALHNGDDLARRVRRLVRRPGITPPSPRRGPRIAAAALSLVAVPCYPAALRVVHALTEHVVEFLG